MPAGRLSPNTEPASIDPAALATLRGRRVLLVEDNELNRLVAMALLGDVAGMHVALANNGHEALAQLRAAPVDLVLMDIQMPGMDGLAATRLIRADAALAQLPVIAMTAHASVGDRESANLAGMDDHVGKPFEPAQLFAVLQRWLAASPAHEATSSTDSAAAPPIAVAVMDVELGLRRCLGKPALYQQIVGRYLQRRAVDGNAVRAALDAGDEEAAARGAHTLISTAAMLGAPTLADVARELHDAIDAGERERWPALLAHIDAVEVAVDRIASAYMRGAASHERTTP